MQEEIIFVVASLASYRKQNGDAVHIEREIQLEAGRNTIDIDFFDTSFLSGLVLGGRYKITITEVAE